MASSSISTERAPPSRQRHPHERHPHVRLPGYAPVPQSALHPALNEHRHYVGRLEQNIYWITDETYRSAFLTNAVGVVLLDAPPTIGNKIKRAVEETDRDLVLENNRA